MTIAPSTGAPTPPVVLILNRLARRSAQIVTNIPSDTGIGPMLLVDSTVSELVHMTGRLRRYAASLPDEAFLPDVLGRLNDLQVRVITAFHKPLFRDERARWVSELDAVSTECYRMALAMQRGEANLQAELARVDHKKQAAKELRKAADGGMNGQLAVLKNRMEDEGIWTPDEPTEADAEVEEAMNLRRRELSHASWYDKSAAIVAEAARFDVGYLDDDDEAGIISYPIILTFFEFERGAEALLSTAGIRTATVYGSYQQIHNCRLMGIKQGNLPGDSTYARRYAQDMLARLKDHPDWGGACNTFYLAHAKPLSGPKHTYFVLMPETCRGHVTIEEWGWGQDVTSSFKSEAKRRNGHKHQPVQSDSPVKKTKAPVIIADESYVKGARVSVISGPYSGMNGYVRAAGPDPRGQVKISVNIFGRNTNLIVYVKDIKAA